MDIGEFTIYNAYLSSALFGLIAITVVGGMESYPPRVSRVNQLRLETYFNYIDKCICDICDAYNKNCKKTYRLNNCKYVESFLCPQTSKSY